MWRFALLGVVGGVLDITSALATELHQNKFKVGTDGLVEAPITVENRSRATISCTAEYAHWYSSELGVAPAGGSLTIATWFEPASGTFLMLNPKIENLPIERLWCGYAGRAYLTRALLAISRHVGASASARVVKCSAEGEHLACD